MKILIHDSLKGAGGINRRVREFLKYQENHRNLEFIIIKLDNENRVIKNGQNISYHISIKDICNSSFPYKGLKSEHAIKERFKRLKERVVEIIRKEKPDIAIIMGTFFFPWAILKACKDQEIKILHLYIGSAMTEFRDRDKILSNSYKNIEKDFLFDADFTVFNSRICKEKIKATFNYIPKKNKIIWNGINSEMSKGNPKENRDGIGYVARYDLFKNPKVLLEIDKKLFSFNKKVTFHLISNIPKETKIYKKFIDKGFHIYQQTHEDYKLREFYQARELLISPSKFETFGNVAIESIAAGIPCITSKGIGASELLKEIGLKKFIVDYNNEEEVCKNIIRVIEEKDMIPNSIRKEMIKKFSWDITISKYLEILKKWK
ncbi:MAG: glycosyltransferase family 4 protein [Nanoarchaeota archaeon]